MEILFLDEIEVIVRFKKVKRLSVSIKAPLGEVFVSAPVSLSLRQVELFIREKENWIRKNRKKIKDRAYLNINSITNNDIIYLWGDAYPNILHNTPPFYFDGENDNYKIYKIYKEELKKVVPPLIFKWSGIMNVSFNEWRIKKMKTRWGSCNLTDKRIWINLKLAAYSKECLESVIVHELCHLIEKPHSKKFYSLMDYYYPSWREAKNLLSSLYIE